jgi:hypothetical protein
MVKKIKFGSRKDANEQREKFEQYLSEKDDRRKKTVKLSEDAPERVLDKAQSAGFESEQAETHNAGMHELSDSELDKIKRVHDNFEWQENGFEAMRVKAALEAKGVTGWQNYYEPGEGVGGAVRTLEQSKRRSAAGGGSVAMDDRHDPDEQVNQRRRQQQTSRMRGRQLESAKEAAVMEGDADAAEFINEERQFGEDVFKIRFSESPTGVPQASGTDLALLEDRNQERSKRARRMDNRRAAKITRDPVTWASAPGQYDFPGIDTVDPQEAHNRRSKRAREKDRNELAPKADTLNEWAADKDHLDWPGVDTPRALGLGSDDADLPEVGSLFGSETASEEVEAAKEQVTVAETDTGVLLESEAEASATDSDVIGAFVSGRAESRDVSVSRGEATRGERTDSIVSFAGPQFDANRERPRETDRREREQEMGIVPEEAFMEAENTSTDVMELDDQQTLGGDRANDQARLAGGETGTVETETETPTMQNEGGLMSDQRDSTGSSTETEQMTPDAFQVAEGGQDTFDELNDLYNDGGDR